MSSSLGYTIKANIYCCFCVVSDYCLFFSYRSRFFFAMGATFILFSFVSLCSFQILSFRVK